MDRALIDLWLKENPIVGELASGKFYVVIEGNYRNIQPLQPIFPDSLTDTVQAGLVADLVSNPYAWPGGYPRYALADDGGALCHKCAETEREIITQSIPGDGWHITLIDVNWESTDLFCDHCSAQIESAYGDSE